MHQMIVESPILIAGRLENAGAGAGCVHVKWEGSLVKVLIVLVDTGNYWRMQW